MSLWDLCALVDEVSELQVFRGNRTTEHAYGVLLLFRHRSAHCPLSTHALTVSSSPLSLRTWQTLLGLEIDFSDPNNQVNERNGK